MTNSETAHSYQASCSWSGSTAAGYEQYDRDHEGHCHPAPADVHLSADAAFRGNPARLNPEQLVLLAASSCQLLSFLAVAARAHVEVRRYDDVATGVMIEKGGGGQFAGITLRPRISVVGHVSSERLHRLAQLAHEQCYIANSLTFEVIVEPVFEVREQYAFGESDVAVQRLALLAEVFGPGSRSFLARHACCASRIAVDLGCGPGWSTRLLAEASGANRTVGMDTSVAFRAVAQAAAPAGVEFVEHDVTQLPFPEPARGATVAYARFLLAHLPDIGGAVAGWLSQLDPLGVLLLEETETIHTTDPAFGDYLALAEQILAARGATLYAGAAVARLATSSRSRVTANEVREVVVPAARAAEMFALNLSVWRDDPAITQPPQVVDELANRLNRLRDEGGSGDLTWTIRQVALSPVQSLGQVRTAIDEIDHQLVDLLAQRGRWVHQAASFKRNEAEVRGPQSRVDHIIGRARATAEDRGADPQVVEDTFRTMIAAFIDAELRIHARRS
ncbi:MAG: chorismate mutase [Pseudonocardiaceae bacterium]